MIMITMMMKKVIFCYSVNIFNNIYSIKLWILSAFVSIFIHLLSVAFPLIIFTQIRNSNITSILFFIIYFAGGLFFNIICSKGCFCITQYRKSVLVFIILSLFVKKEDANSHYKIIIIIHANLLFCFCCFVIIFLFFNQLPKK